MLRHGLSARELWTAAAMLRDAPAGPARGDRPAPAAGPGLPPPRGQPADERRRGRRAPDGSGATTLWVSHLTARRARPAARVLPRLHVPAADRHRPVARRPRRAAGHLDGPRRAPGRARRRLRLPRPDRARRPATSWSSAAAPPTASGSRPRPASRLAPGPGRDPGPRRPRRGRLRALAVLDRRQAAALRRAAAHAGLDALPARTAPRCPASATEIDVRVRFTATAFDRVVVS